jgi:hypothetical protein
VKRFQGALFSALFVCGLLCTLTLRAQQPSGPVAPVQQVPLPVPVPLGGTGASNAALARAALNAYPVVNLADLTPGDGLYLHDGVIASGTTALHSSSATFTSADCHSGGSCTGSTDKTIVVHGAGAAGAPLTTTIVNFVDSHDVTIGTAASTSAPLYQIYAASINAAGSGGTNGSCTLTGADGTGTPYTINATIAGNVVSALGTFVSNGSYSVLPPSLSADPVTPTGCGSLTGVTLTISPTNYTTSGGFQYCTDGSAALATVVPEIELTGGLLYIPTANFCLSSQVASIVLNNLSIIGDGLGANSSFGITSSQLWVFNQSTAEFIVEANVYWRGVNVWYPQQDGYASTPTVFPPLFGVSPTKSMVDDTFVDSNFINPYIRLQVDNTSLNSGIGRVFFLDTKGFGILYTYYATEGGADVVEFRDLEIGTNAAPDLTSGFAYLASWSNANGMGAYFNMGSATKQFLVGFTFDPNIIHGYEFGVQVASGGLQDAVIEPKYCDAVLTCLAITGTGYMTGSFQATGWVYATNPYSAGTETNAALACDSSGAISRINVLPSNFIYSRGNAIEMTANCYTSFDIGGGQITAWGQSATPGSYYAIKSQTSGEHNLNIHGTNQIATAKSGNSQYCTYLAKHYGATTINGNLFNGCVAAVYDASNDSTSPSVTSLASNVSVGTTGSVSIHPASAGTFVDDHSNSWDKPLAATVSSGFGTSPSISCPVNWQGCRVTVGSSPGGSGVIAWPFTLPAAPACTAIDDTSGVALGAVATTTGATVTGTTALSDVVGVTCL